MRDGPPTPHVVPADDLGRLALGGGSRSPRALVARTGSMLGHAVRAADGAFDLGDGCPPVTLTVEEARRSAGLRSALDRADYVAAHLLVRAAVRLLAPEAGPVTLVQRCDSCDCADHGRPTVLELPELHVSLTHCRGAVAAAAGWSPVGVDLEPLAARRPPDDLLLGAALGLRERELVRCAPDPVAAFLRLWVRKEALVKVGATTLDRLPEVDLSTLPAAACSVDAEGLCITAAGRWEAWAVTDWWDGAFLGSAVGVDEVRVQPWRPASG